MYNLRVTKMYLNTVTMYLNTFENTFKCLFKKILKVVLKRSLHYTQFVIKKISNLK